MKIKWIVCMGLVLIAVCLGVSFNYAHGISNFKCTNQSRYRITRNSVVYDFYVKEGANKRGNSSRLTQSFHFFMFEPIFSPVNALNQPI